MSANKGSFQFELFVGALCLDFVNTLDDRPAEEPKELLRSYSDFAQFARQAGIVVPAQLHRLLELSGASPHHAERALTNAIRLREALNAIFESVARQRPVPQGALEALNEFVQEAARHSRIIPGKTHFQWGMDDSADDLESPLWPIVRSAADLLVSDQLPYVRACSSKTCQWLFVDTSKNHRRRWCDMKVCGNRAKSRRFYSRQKKEN
jgi:predicted RNA-binding Zn ribbon-like protein